MPNPNLHFSKQLASAFADLGVEHACVSPGSRNTPLLAAFAAEQRIRSWTVLDERSAAFFAMGLARATCHPVVLVCTSGTAAAEFHPAIIEASHSHVPLLVLTADRPAELRGVGAPQTIDQIELFGSSTKLFVDATPPDDSTACHQAQELAIAAWVAATTGIPGPVHINLPFREPLLTGESTPAVAKVQAPEPEAPDPPDLSPVADRISGRNGIIVAGRSNDPQFPAACTRLAAATGYSIIADPLSGIRFGTHSLDHVLATGDALAAAGALDTLSPDLVIRFGPVPTSKATWGWLKRNPDIEQILIDIEGRDATHSAATVLALPAAHTAQRLAAEVTASAPGSWTTSWLELDRLAAEAIAKATTTAPFPNEPAIAHTVFESAPSGATVTIGSSMPIRDVDTYAGKSSQAINVFGNRGANGIDGVVSSALGSATTGQPAVVLVGDVSMFHDLNALGTAAQLGLPITIVVVNNDGGGIFHFLPYCDPAILPTAIFEEHMATPHGTDFVAIANALGIGAFDVDTADELSRLVGSVPNGPHLIQLKTDRTANLELHRAVASQVENTLATWAPTRTRTRPG